MTTVVVTENLPRHRFEIHVDGALAGYCAYRLAGEQRYIFVHTEIDAAFEGQGLASQLIHEVLKQMRARRMEVVPYCPFVKAYIIKHPTYAELVPEDVRARLGIGVEA